MYSKIETNEEIDELVSLAYEIWSGHFGSMFDSQTLSILIEAAQSKQVILNQIADGYAYFFINEDNERIGYFAYKINQAQKKLFLSKLYLRASKRGMGMGEKVVEYLRKLCIGYAVNKIELTVYCKNSDAVKAYEKWGFLNLGIIKRDFGNGLICDDIKMQKPIL